MKCFVTVGSFSLCFPDETDAGFLSRARVTRDEDARLEALLAEYGRRLRALLLRLCPPDLRKDLDDIEQEARVRLWRALSRERNVIDVASYLRRVATSVTID